MNLKCNMNQFFCRNPHSIEPLNNLLHPFLTCISKGIRGESLRSRIQLLDDFLILGLGVVYPFSFPSKLDLMRIIP